MKTSRLIAAVLALSPLAAMWPAAAQDMALASPELLGAELAGPMGNAHYFIGEDDTFAFAAGQLHSERVVKGAPYCADALQESVQPLADGNRIVRKQTTRLCRDGEGRTRQEVERGGRKIVYLRDPVSRESWLLDPTRKTARRLLTHASLHEAHEAHQQDSAAWREYTDKMRDWAKNFREQMKKDGNATPPAPPAPPTPSAMPAPPAMPVVITLDDRDAPEAPEAGRKAPKNMRVQVIRVDNGGNVLYTATPPGVPAVPGTPGVPAVPAVPGVPPAPPLPAVPPVPAIAPLPPGVAAWTHIGAPRGPGVASSLGTKDIEGVKANGERTTWTIEAGKLGNEKPIVITRDVWTSPDLMVTVLTKDADPRVGETTYRLANLKRGEPEAGLMRVPGDYAVDKGRFMPKAPGGAASKG
jgi:hypothetical protein